MYDRPEGVAEYKETFLDTLKRLEASTKYMRQFDTKNNITVICNKVENELYKPRAPGKRNKTLIEWLVK
jgi:hypothetical protein